MALPTNILQTVQTYQDSSLAFFQNLACFVSTANKKFNGFEDKEANLGDTVTFDLPTRFSSANSLVATFQSAEQYVQSLTVNKAKNVSYAFSAQQFIFNVREYMDKFGRGAIAELATEVEADVASVCETTPYRFYGNGVTAINSYQQLAQALALFRNYSMANNDVKCYLQDTAVPAIVGSGLNQFVTKRNEDIAMSWELGRFSNCDFYQSNLLPLHTAGTIGNDGTTLTVVSTNDPTGANITQITFSGAGTDSDAIKAYDSFQFQDGVSGQPNLRFLTFVGHKVSANPVQFIATADAASSGGNVTVTVSPALCATSGDKNQNLNHNIVAGMQVKVLPDHRCGLITADNPLFVAIPRLPEEVPFPTANKTDPETGVSLRMYYGSLFGQNQRGFVNDVIWGKTLVNRNVMKIAFPVTA
jgi:hypothetical protein